MSFQKFEYKKKVTCALPKAKVEEDEDAEVVEGRAEAIELENLT